MCKYARLFTHVYEILLVLFCGLCDHYMIWEHVYFITMFENNTVIGFIQWNKIIPEIIKILEKSFIKVWLVETFILDMDFFFDKTSNLQNQTLRIITFEHIPATFKRKISNNSFGTSLQEYFQYMGTEIEVKYFMYAIIN